MKTILYLHGLGASPLSFRYIQHKLPEHKILFVQMNPADFVDTTIARVSTFLEGHEDVTIVAHSLGGLIGVGLLSLPSVSGLVSMASPFGGHPVALVMGLWSNEPIFKDLSPYGGTIRRLQRKWATAGKPHLAIVTTSGVPFMGYDNDGVVTIASQTTLVGPRYEALALNHFEVLLSDEAVNLIQDFVW
jgi:pimeloyl-ACP methyl ester carboxylesterase